MTMIRRLFSTFLPLVVLASGFLLPLSARAATNAVYLIPPVADRDIKIDGALRDWKDKGMSIVVDPLHVAGGVADPAFRGPADCQGTLHVAYDAENLYLGLEVTDDSVRPLEKKSGVPGKFWEQDGMGVYLDAPGINSASGRYSTKRTRPWQPEPILQLTPSTGDFGAEVLPEGSRYACRISKDGYVVEAAVPWVALGWQPVSGDRLLFAAILADIDRGADGKDGPLKQVLWHMPQLMAKPTSREWAEARLVNPAGYGGELMVEAPAAAAGARIAWKFLADAAQAGWQVSGVAVAGAGGARQSLTAAAAPVQPGKRLSLSGTIDTAGLTPGLYAVEAVAGKGAQVEKVQQALQVVSNENAVSWHRAPAVPQQYMTADPFRSQMSADVSLRPHAPITHAAYLEFVRKESDAYWPSVDYHLKARTLSLGGGWYFDYALRASAYAKVSGDTNWLNRAQGLFELANDAFKTNNYSGLGWINFPLIYYCKQYMTSMNAWKPEYEAMVKDWYLHAFPGFPKEPSGVWYGMNNWGLSSGIRGVMGEYWLGDQLPDKEKWQKHVQDTWGEFLHNVKDIDENTTNYAPWDLWLILFYLDVTGQIDLLKTDARLRYLFERYIYEIASSGARPQYGSTNGWHDGPATWMYIFERVGQLVGDGRYKYQARMLWDYSLRHVEDWHQYHLVYDQTLTMLTRLLAEVPDDSLPAVPVEAKSLVTTRGAMRLLPAEERQRRNMWIDTTSNAVPNKIIFRGSNAPGSLWAMVEMNGEAGHCGARPTSVNCLMDQETVLLASQGYYEQDPQFHNMVLIEDLEGTQGVQPDMDIKVTELQEGPAVAYAVAQVDRYMQWPVTLRRHYVFAKDRFMWVRDELDFKSTFFARIGPCWLSRQMGPKSGENWVNMYFDMMPYTGLGQGNGLHRWKNYNYDLLLYCVPRPGMDLAMADLLTQNPYMNAPLQVRQTWRGLAEEGKTLVFDTLLLPHGLKLRDADPMWLAKTIKPLSTDAGQTAVEFELPWKKEKVVIVSADKPFAGGGITTDAKKAMVVWRDGQVANWFVYQGKSLKAGDKVLLDSAQPVTKQE